MCIMPWYRSDIKQMLPCGGCYGCRRDRLLLWTARAQYEHSRYQSASFLTLTYDEYHLPRSHALADPSLCKQQATGFFNRLHGKCPPHARLLVGEYGDRFARPHYHALIYGLDWHDYMPVFDKTWPHGSIKSLPVSAGSVRYVLDYMRKNINGPLAVELYDKTLRERPFFTASRHFGEQFFSDHAEEISKTGFVSIGSRLCCVPTHYKNIYAKKDSASVFSREEFLLENIVKPFRAKARAHHMTDDEYRLYISHANYESQRTKDSLDGIPLDVRYSF